jgi:enamine deaminase RidA (YjgF/YER057c/UK114 family)
VSIKRIQTGPRMSQAVIHNHTLYLAGQVASGAPAGSVAEQTKDILSKIDALLAEAETDESKILSATIWLTDMSTFSENERGLGSLGRADCYPGASNDCKFPPGIPGL